MEKRLKSLDSTNPISIKLKPLQYIIALVGITLAIVGTYFLGNHFGLTKSETIGLFVAFIATIALVYNALHLQNNFMLNREKILLDSRIATFNALKEWNNNFRYESRVTKKFIHDNCIVKNLKNEALLNELDKIGDDNIAYIEHLRKILNFYEILCIGINTETLNEDMIKECLSDMFTNYYHYFSYFISERRKSNEPMKNAFVHFESTIKRWNEQNSRI